jgi:hypothetical protein
MEGDSMNNLSFSGFLAICAVLLPSSTTKASSMTIGPFGIDSAGLTDASGQPLTGEDISIGQSPGSHSGLIPA